MSGFLIEARQKASKGKPVSLYSEADYDEYEQEWADDHANRINHVLSLYLDRSGDLELGRLVQRGLLAHRKFRESLQVMEDAEARTDESWNDGYKLDLVPKQRGTLPATISSGREGRDLTASGGGPASRWVWSRQSSEEPQVAIQHPTFGDRAGHYSAA